MKQTRTTRALTLAVAGAAIAGSLALPAVALADPGFGPGQPGPGGPAQPGQPGPGGPGGAPASWNHPEWGPGWNNGYPQQGWQPPEGWQPPQGWTNPTNWQPPAGAAWCGGPILDVLNPICWFRPQ